MATEFVDKSISGALKFDHIVFDEISFKREGFQKADTEMELGFGKNVEKTGKGKYRVSLLAKATKKGEYEATVRITGFCKISEDEPFKEKILNENAIAILFPYVRAELTLLTAQPETEALTIPVVNVSAVFKGENEAKKAE